MLLEELCKDAKARGYIYQYAINGGVVEVLWEKTPPPTRTELLDLPDLKKALSERGYTEPSLGEPDTASGVDKRSPRKASTTRASVAGRLSGKSATEGPASEVSETPLPTSGGSSSTPDS